MSHLFDMHNVLETMAAEHETPISLYFKMSAAVLWRNELKIEYEEDYEETKNRLFAILGWLGRVSLGNPFVASCDLASYLKFSVSKFNNGPSIFINHNRFPYKEDTVNEWFNLPPEDDWPERGEAVKVINVDKCGLARKCYRTQNQVENAFPDSLEDDEFEVFFHGTSHEGAKDIIEHGINLKKGAPAQDFSNGDGFYLSKHFDKALEWARSRRTSFAVLVFRLKKTELRGNNNEKGYDLREPAEKKKWQEVIKQFRRGKPDRKFLKDMNRCYQFIEGPMASLSSKNPKTLFPVPQDDSYQICVRGIYCAKLFDYSLHSSVFLDK